MLRNKTKEKKKGRPSFASPFHFNFRLSESQMFVGTFILRRSEWAKWGELLAYSLVYSRGNKADFVTANAITRVGGRAESHYEVTSRLANFLVALERNVPAMQLTLGKANSACARNMKKNDNYATRWAKILSEIIVAAQFLTISFVIRIVFFKNYSI